MVSTHKKSAASLRDYPARVMQHALSKSQNFLEIQRGNGNRYPKSNTQYRSGSNTLRTNSDVDEKLGYDPYHGWSCVPLINIRCINLWFYS